MQKSQDVKPTRTDGRVTDVPFKFRSNYVPKRIRNLQIRKKRAHNPVICAYCQIPPMCFSSCFAINYRTTDRIWDCNGGICVLSSSKLSTRSEEGKSAGCHYPSASFLLRWGFRFWFLLRGPVCMCAVYVSYSASRCTHDISVNHKTLGCDFVTHPHSILDTKSAKLVIKAVTIPWTKQIDGSGRLDQGRWG